MDIDLTYPGQFCLAGANPSHCWRVTSDEGRGGVAVSLMVGFRGTLEQRSVPCYRRSPV